MVEIRNVQYRAGATQILHDVSLTFRPERFNVILGPNGAGKSTLLKLATGLLKPTGGEVLYGGRNVREIDVNELARRRAVLSQHVELAFPLAVEDVVLMGRYPHYASVPRARDREIVEEALDLVEMGPMRRRSYPTLSGGEQQKVQLARVLAQIWNDPESREEKYLFLDEPTSNLDVYYELHLLDIARDLLGTSCTVIAILHDLNVALRYGDAFFVLERGGLAQEADSAAGISRELIERVFRVRAQRTDAAENGESYWRFSSAR
ncbi:MAG: heme ABC transporter ATP-binding protein [Gemmatimonadaceae bacterium]